MRKLPTAIATAMKKAGVTKQSKYRAVPTVVDGIRFDSKAEAEYYRRLKLLQSNNEIALVLRQVPFDLPGGHKHRVDFMTFEWSEFYLDGRIIPDNFKIELVEIKGKDLGTGKMKRKQVEELYGIKIHVLRAVYRRGVVIDFEEVET